MWKGDLNLLQSSTVVLPYMPDICHFFTRAKFLENKIYTEKTSKLRQNTQKIANFLRYYGKIHSKLPIFRVKSLKIYTGQKIYTGIPVAPVTNIRYARKTKRDFHNITYMYIYLPRVGFSDYCTEFMLCIDFKSNLYGLQFYHASNHIITNAF